MKAGGVIGDLHNQEHYWQLPTDFLANFHQLWQKRHPGHHKNNSHFGFSTHISFHFSSWCPFLSLNIQQRFQCESSVYNILLIINHYTLTYIDDDDHDHNDDDDDDDNEKLVLTWLGAGTATPLLSTLIQPMAACIFSISLSLSSSTSSSSLSSSSSSSSLRHHSQYHGHIQYHQHLRHHDQHHYYHVIELVNVQPQFNIIIFIPITI